MIVAVTGHRKLGHHPDEIMKVFREKLRLSEATAVCSGMALGFDQLVVEECLALGIPVHGYIPCAEQDKFWPLSCRLRYATLIQQIKQAGGKIIYVSDQPYAGPTDMERRNRAMVDVCNQVIAYWNGDSGGTANCVRYSLMKHRQITNLWKDLPCPLSQQT